MGYKREGPGVTTRPWGIIVLPSVEDSTPSHPPLLSHDITDLQTPSILRCEQAFHDIGGNASTTACCSEALVRYLFDEFHSGDGRTRACSLVRLYRTMQVAQLDGARRSFALARLSGDLVPEQVKCLTLLASAGEEPAWNDSLQSTQHLAIPLPTPDFVSGSPMIASLFRQLGVDVGALLGSGTNIIVAPEKERYNVFYVPEAAGSPHIPAQASFVARYRIRSVLGFGGLLPDGNVFAVILFSRVFIPRKTADRFRLLTLAARRALLAAGDRIWLPSGG